MAHIKHLRFIIFIVLISSIPLPAQAGFRQGKIITLKGDTLNGYINYQSDKNLCNICMFRIDRVKAVHRYYPKDIRSYQFTKESRKFISDSLLMQDSKIPVFMEVIQVGHFNIYHFTDMDLKNYFFINRIGDTKVVYLPFKRYYEKETYDHGLNQYSKIYTRTTTYHIDSLKMILKDAPGVFDQIERIDEPNLKNLKKLLISYQKSFEQK